MHALLLSDCNAMSAQMQPHNEVSAKLVPEFGWLERQSAGTYTRGVLSLMLPNASASQASQL
jgi:hypothetical protein